MALGRAVQKLLRSLLESGEVSEAQFKEKALLNALKENRIVRTVPRGKTRKSVKLIDGEALLQYLRVEHALELRETWAECVTESPLPEPLKHALLAAEVTLPGKSGREIVTRIGRGLALLERGMSRRTISALLFWGDSKVLDDKPGVVAALGGSEPPLLLNVSLPTHPFSGVLFIENYDTYAACAAAGMPEETVLIYSAGFGGSALRIREIQGALLHYAPGPAGERTRFETWLRRQSAEALPVAFFGDFDFAGMEIFRSLRRSFPEIALYRPGYEAMLEAVRRGNGHVAKKRAKDQNDPGTIGDRYADTVLLPAMRQHGFYDQEGVASVSFDPLSDCES